MKKFDTMSDAVLCKLQEIRAKSELDKLAAKIDNPERYELEAIIDEINDKSDKNTLGGRPCMWNKEKTIWTQPPVPIYHGDLVNIEYNSMTDLLGRYIGKGYGIAELYNYSTGVSYHIGKVTGRGLDQNPRLISDEDLFYFIKD